ncbi:hypothetical protein [Rhodoferax sp.]|nr:hypothetical protein [Rhodoferax sp.]
MTTKIPQATPEGLVTGSACAPEFMALGFRPNPMDRFMQSNSHEVLFVY